MSATSKIAALLLTTAGTLTLGGAVLFGAVYGGLNGKGQGTANASTEPSGIIGTDAELGVLQEETQQLLLAVADQPVNANDKPDGTSSTDVINSKSAQPLAPNALPDEDADLSSEEEAKLEREAQEKLMEKLNKPVTFNYPDVPFKKAAELIADQCEVVVVLDHRFNHESRVRLVANGETLASALRTMLANFDGQKLYFSTEHGVIRFDSADVLERESLRKQRLAHFNRRARAPFVSDSDADRLASVDENSRASAGATQQESTAGPGGQSNRSQIVAAIRNLDAADLKVYEALDQTTSLEFPDNTIQEVFDYVASLHGITIRFDRRHLESEGVSLESRVQCVLDEVSLRTALPLILESVTDGSLDYYIEGGILFITTSEAALRTRLRFYDFSSGVDNLAETVESYIKNSTFSERCSMISLDGCLAINTSYAIHREIEEFIVGVMQVAEARKAAGKEFVIPKPEKPRMTPQSPTPAVAPAPQPGGAASPAAGGSNGGGGGFN